jgi:hypothetical protein
MAKYPSSSRAKALSIGANKVRPPLSTSLAKTGNSRLARTASSKTDKSLSRMTMSAIVPNTGTGAGVCFAVGCLVGMVTTGGLTGGGFGWIGFCVGRATGFCDGFFVGWTGDFEDGCLVGRDDGLNDRLLLSFRNRFQNC